MWHDNVAYYAMKRAKACKEGRFFELLTAMLFSAFALEAYLNHLGKVKLSYWDELEKALTADRKLRVLLKVIGHSPDFDSRPYQTFRSIFTFRNRLVHAKTVVLEKEYVLIREEGERLPEPLADWEGQVTLGRAQCFFEDMQAMIRDLHKRAGFKRDPFAYPEFIFAESEPLPEDET